MTIDATRPVIPHASRCQRRGAPILRLSWDGRPEAWCPSCGRRADLPDPANQNNVVAIATTNTHTDEGTQP